MFFQFLQKLFVSIQVWFPDPTSKLLYANAIVVHPGLRPPPPPEQIRLRKSTEQDVLDRDCRESVCWTWLGHRLFILTFDNYNHIRNESIYKKNQGFDKICLQIAFYILFLQLNTIF